MFKSTASKSARRGVFLVALVALCVGSAGLLSAVHEKSEDAFVRYTLYSMGHTVGLAAEAVVDASIPPHTASRLIADASQGMDEVWVLHGRSYLAHPDPSRIGSRLSRDGALDKEHYDLLRSLKREADDGSSGYQFLFAEDGQTRAIVPFSLGEEVVGIVEVRSSAIAVGVPWKTYAGLAAFFLVGLGLMALAPGHLPLLTYLALGGSFIAMLGPMLVAPSQELIFDYGMAMDSLDAGLESGLSPYANTSLEQFLSVALFIVVYGFAAYFMTNKGWNFALEIYSHREAYLYVAPAIVATGALIFFPFFYGIVLAFFEVNRSEATFVGVDNFVEILTDMRVNEPENFYFTLGVTILWTGFNVFLHVSIGLALALALNKAFVGLKGIWRAILVLPWAIPNYITALIWRGMFHAQFGAVNAFLALFGIEKSGWFNDFWPAFSANVTTNTWLGFPFMMVVSLGALQSIPKELYEAARVDGASAWDQFRHITLPLLKPALFPAVILGTIWTFNMFNIIYLVSGGAPSQATDILVVQAYRQAFEKYRYGYAAAYSTIIFLLLLGYTLATNRITQSEEGAY